MKQIKKEIKEFKRDDKFYGEAVAFAEAIIERYKAYYKVD